MNEIKFRAWSKTLKEMTPITSFKALLVGSLESERAMLARNWDDLIFMQCIGLKDKDDNEICSGDILEGHDGDRFHFEYRAPLLYKIPIDGNDNSFLMNSDFMGSKIIGNIYKNPELLK